MLVDRIIGKIPNYSISNKKVLKGVEWIGKNLSTPENRLILGVTALMSQPFIDLHNRRVDEETRKVSAARTVAKIIAGTLTGVIIRAGCIKGIEKLTKMPHEIKPGMNKKLATLFTPDLNKVILKDLTQYKNALGTIISLFVMTITNFTIDAPLTKFLTNKFVDRIHEKEKLQKQNKLNNWGVK